MHGPNVADTAPQRTRVDGPFGAGLVHAWIRKPLRRAVANLAATDLHA